MTLKDKDQLWFGQILPLVLLACGYLDCVGQNRTILGSKAEYGICRMHWGTT